MDVHGDDRGQPAQAGRLLPPASAATAPPQVRKGSRDPGHAILDLAMRAGDLLLSAGMSAHEVVVTMQGITSAYGLTPVHVDVTYTAISASHHPAPEIPPVTYTRVVRPGDADDSQVRHLLQLCSNIRRGLLFAEAAAAFEGIWSARHPYPPSSVPGFGLISAAILPFVPGLALYNGLLQVIGTPAHGADLAQGTATLFPALSVALGIAAGASLGTYLGRPIADQIHRMPVRS